MVKDLKKSVKRTGFRHMENGLKTLLVSVVRDGSYAQACACHLHATVSSAVLVVAYASSLRSCSIELLLRDHWIHCRLVTESRYVSAFAKTSYGTCDEQ